MSEARDGFEQFLLAAAGDAGDAEDLAAVRDKAYVFEFGDPFAVAAGESCDGQAGFGIDRIRPVDVQGHGAAHHHLGELLRIRLRGAHGPDMLTLAQDRHDVGDRHDLVEFVRDQDDGLAVLLHGLQDAEQLVRLLRRQHCRGLVQDEDVGAAVQHFDDLDRLLFRNGHAVDLLVGIDVEAVLFGDLADAFGDLLQVVLAVLDAQRHVLRGCEHVDQFEMLMDHADAVREGVLGVADGDFLSVHEDLPLVRIIDARQHVHERRLAGAVFAEQRHNNAVINVKIDFIVGNDATETLRDVFQFYCVCHVFLTKAERGRRAAALFRSVIHVRGINMLRSAARCRRCADRKREQT